VDTELFGIYGLPLEDDTMEGLSLPSLILSLCSVLFSFSLFPVTAASESGLLTSIKE
jgi:hypothetical protein